VSPPAWARSPSTTTSSPTPQRARRRAAPTSGDRRVKREKRHDEEVAPHTKKVIDALHDLALRQPFDRLIVAGTKKATAQLERLLPRRLQGKLVRTLTMPVTASKKDILEGVLKLQKNMEREQENALIDGLEAELHDDITAVRDEYDPLTEPLESKMLRPRRADVEVRLVTLLWTPSGAAH